jgi:molybdate transport system ATP-binding protein
MLRVSVRKQRGEFALDAAFEAPSPAVVALFGPSGCGKTTVVNLVAGLLAPDEGRIELDGEMLCDTARGIAVPAEQRRLGYVFQDARLFPHLSARRNLEYGWKRSDAVAGPVRFDDVVALLGLGALLDRRPHALSGGERQRVAIGRALLSQPRLLLLDEPLASLDAARREDVLPYLEKLRDQWRIPMLYVSHQFEEVVRLATHVVVLEQGRTSAVGPLTAVALDPALARLAGEAAIGAIIDSTVTGVEADTGLVRVSAGSGEIRVMADALQPGVRIRLQLLARDIMLATRSPEGLSVRNVLPGRVTGIAAESAHSELVSIDIGGIVIVARVTGAARRELGIATGTTVWALIKAVSIRGRAL